MLFLAPLLVIIPPQATAATLVLVGAVMLQGVARIDTADLASTVPIALTVLATALTFSLVDGLVFGTFIHVANEIVLGRRARLTATCWILAAACVAYVVWCVPGVRNGIVASCGDLVA